MINCVTRYVYYRYILLFLFSNVQILQKNVHNCNVLKVNDLVSLNTTKIDILYIFAKSFSLKNVILLKNQD